jgi:hypothetical protein
VYGKAAHREGTYCNGFRDWYHTDPSDYAHQRTTAKLSAFRPEQNSPKLLHKLQSITETEHIASTMQAEPAQVKPIAVGRRTFAELSDLNLDAQPDLPHSRLLRDNQ